MRRIRSPPRRTKPAESKYDHLHTLIHQLIESVHNLKEITMASNAELQQSLADLSTQVRKAKAEIVAKISALEEALQNAPGGTTPEVDQALAALKGDVQELDDLHPDV